MQYINRFSFYKNGDVFFCARLKKRKLEISDEEISNVLDELFDMLGGISVKILNSMYVVNSQLAMEYINNLDLQDHFNKYFLVDFKVENENLDSLLNIMILLSPTLDDMRIVDYFQINNSKNRSIVIDNLVSDALSRATVTCGVNDNA